MLNGNVLIINTGSTSTKLGYYADGKKVLVENITHTKSELEKFNSVMEQISFRKNAITEFLLFKSISLEDVDIIMARGGLLYSINSGIYEINEVMKSALINKGGVMHSCNLSALIADDLRAEIINLNPSLSVRAFIADAPTSDEMSDVARLLGLPDIQRRSSYHALNSKAMVRRYAKENNIKISEINVIVAHLGGGTSISLHSKGLVIDVTDAVEGEGPISPDRVGSLPTTPLIELCFSGKYTKEELNSLLFQRGGAIAYFNTNDFKELIERSAEDERIYKFLEAYCLSISKYIASLTANVNGDIQAIILTGGIAYSDYIVDKIFARIGFLAPVLVYPGENEIEALAENGYGILSGDITNFPIKTMQ